MYGFDEISDIGGVDLLAKPRPFMTVPWHSSNLVIRDLPKGGRLPAGNHFVEVRDITGERKPQYAEDMNKQGYPLLATLALFNIRMLGDAKRMLIIGGKTPGITTLHASRGGHLPSDSIDVAVLRPKTVTVSFKFFRHLDENGNPAGTKFKPQDAPAFLEAMNRIYARQANITFKLLHADPLMVNERFGPVIMDETVTRHLEPALDKSADITVFLVGKFSHSRTRTANGTHETIGKNHLVVLNDEPTGEGTGVDPFQQTFAHELGHCLGAGHEKRDHVLMSVDQQSLKISKEMVAQINPW